MKKHLFARLAWTGMKKNRRLYLPYLLTCVGMVMMQYIVGHLSRSQVLKGLRGGSMLCEMLNLGNYVVALFALLFLSYSSSFLMRRRRREFGLYNILGMGKRHLTAVLLWETLFTTGISLAAGLLAGAALSKAAELCIVNFMHGTVDYQLTLCVDSLLQTALAYALIFAVILLRSLWQIRRSSALSLLSSESTGDKPPRLCWLWGTLGAGMLAYAYYLAVSIASPTSALGMFFQAVLLVIAATYLLFVSGSVLLCRLLKRNRRYYYQANHFVSVSSMEYRMRRTGAGLASICILLTMVLVMLSSTSCLYFGVEDSLQAAYPRQLVMTAYSEDLEHTQQETFQPLKEHLTAVAASHGARTENTLEYRVAKLYGQIADGQMETDYRRMETRSADVYGSVWTVHLIPLEDYNRLAGEQRTLARGEALLYTLRAAYAQEALRVSGTDWSLHIAGRLEDFPVETDALTSINPEMYLVISDFQETLQTLDRQLNARSGSGLSVYWIYGCDVNADEEVQQAICEETAFGADESLLEHLGYVRYDCRAEERDSYTGTFAGLFMLGMILSTVFLLAAVLMIYYKQITEGYEDQRRFEIMQKVGMTARDIRRSVNSQMLTVFMLPLLTAGLHMIFAFPMIRLMLLLFNMTNTALFIETSLISFAVFALFYVVVYRITSNAYCSIVSAPLAAEG